jgi:hypothetical protein
MALDPPMFAVVPAFVEALAIGAGLVSTGAIGATIKAVIDWVRSGERVQAQRVVIEVDGRRTDLSGKSGEDLERSLHAAIDHPEAPSSAPGTS